MVNDHFSARVALQAPLSQEALVTVNDETWSMKNSAMPLLTEAHSGITLVHRGEQLMVAVSSRETPAVKHALSSVAADVARICGVSVETQGSAMSARVVVGTIGVSPLIEDAMREGRLDAGDLRDETGALRWESFLITLVGDDLYIVGSDRRGTIFGLYEFAEQLGVSPWQWWGQAPERHLDDISIAPGFRLADWPSVRYRGVFINDEEELFHWAQTHTPDDTIGPATYHRLFELILRLKGNYLWPAMHVGAFNADPRNGRLAEELGIVIGSSHCDILLRSNEHEFLPWAARQDVPVSYDYSLDGRNRELLKDYWRESVEQNKAHEVTWTVGVRGIHDTGFVTAEIDDDPDLDDDQKLRARVDLLQTAIGDQRQILADVLGEAVSGAPQLFIPYKEVLPLYDAGLALPDDITVMWTNDNFGYVRRYPSETELQRSGGHGLYYHSSYWSTPTTSYLGTSSTPLALMKSELESAWDAGIRQVWVDNVGGLKPLEIETEYFLRQAWDAGKEAAIGALPDFVESWIDDKFTGGIGREASQLLLEHYQLNNQRKYEHLSGGVFPQTGYGDEAGRRLDALQRLYDATNDLLRSLPRAERDCFFQLFAVKIHMAYLVNAQFVYADRSTLCFDQGKFAAADEYLAVSRRFDDHKRALIHYFNHVMSDGMWSGMFTPEEFPPPVIPLYPAGKPALAIDGSRLEVRIWGDAAPASDRSLDFWPHGITHKWIEIANIEWPGTGYTVTADPWILVERIGRAASAEARLIVSVDDVDAHRGDDGTVTVRCLATGEVVTVGVHVALTADLPDGFVGVVEADGHVSIDPSAPDAQRAGTASRWMSVPFLGRYGNAALRVVGTSEDGSQSHSATAEYRFVLRTAGAHPLEIHRLPTLNATGRIRVGVSVDDHAVLVAESPTTDEHRGDWESAVQDNVERLTLQLPFLEAGEHVLRLHAVDERVTVSKLVIYSGIRRPTNLGPDFSLHTGRQRQRPRQVDPDPARHHLEAVEAVSREIFRTDPSTVPLLDQVYADAAFWQGDATLRPNTSVPQAVLAQPKSWATGDGRKDVIGALGSGIVLEDHGVMAWEAENVLVQDGTAWTSPEVGGVRGWSHTQSETCGRTGLAMHVASTGASWPNAEHAPGLHYRLMVTAPGAYRLWMLVKFADRNDDSCFIAVDGRVQPLDAQFSGGELCAYGTRQVWVWAAISDVELSEGTHTLSVHARKAGLRIDRIYLTACGDRPPIDAEWSASVRIADPVQQTDFPTQQVAARN